MLLSFLLIEKENKLTVFCINFQNNGEMLVLDLKNKINKDISKRNILRKKNN